MLNIFNNINRESTETVTDNKQFKQKKKRLDNKS